jgi:hypothetical protein
MTEGPDGACATEPAIQDHVLTAEKEPCGPAKGEGLAWGTSADTTVISRVPAWFVVSLDVRIRLLVGVDEASADRARDSGQQGVVSSSCPRIGEHVVGNVDGLGFFFAVRVYVRVGLSD